MVAMVPTDEHLLVPTEVALPVVWRLVEMAVSCIAQRVELVVVVALVITVVVVARDHQVQLVALVVVVAQATQPVDFRVLLIVLVAA